MAKLSIFKTLQRELGDQLPVVSLTKATLVHLSHTLEDFVLTRKLPAMLFTGFQESSHWRKETERYRALAEVALQVTVFAGDPLPDDQPVDVLHVTLGGDDPLRQEWFITILSSELSVVLCGLDNMRDVDEEAHRQFDTVWSFDTNVVNSVLDVLEGVLSDYHPQVMSQLVAARHEHPPVDPDIQLVTTFARELLRFEDQLQATLLQKNHALTVSEALYRSVVMNAPVVLFRLDSSGRVMLCSGKQSAVLFPAGVPQNGELIFEHITHIPRLADYIRLALAGDEINTVLHTDNNQVYELRTARVTPSKSKDGIICVLVDVTARVRSEEARLESERLQVALEKERELSELRKQLMLTLSHELRTPLSTIRSASDLLTRYNDRLSEEKRWERLYSIQDQVNQLSRILSDIDMVIYSDDKLFKIKPALTSLLELCEQVAYEIEGHYKRQVVCECAPDVEQVYIDARWMRYIFSNLFSNAAKYSPPESPIEAQVWREGDTLMIRVRDYGIGIPEDEIQHIFEPFYRASNVGVVGGTGLGLVITRNIVHAHDGSIDIQTAEQDGTTILITIPLTENGDDGSNPANAQASVTS